MYRIPGLVLATAAAFLLLAVPASAQAVPAPTLSGLPTAGIPARLIAASADLMLRPQQVRSLEALSTQLAWEGALQRLSSKPWNTAARLTSPAQASVRALRLLDSAQRTRAVALLGGAAETGP